MALIKELAEFQDGMLGAQILPRLRQALDLPTFDFSDVGYASALKFARSMSASDVRIVHEGQPDFKIEISQTETESEREFADWARHNSAIKEYAFTSDRTQRQLRIGQMVAICNVLGEFSRRQLLDAAQSAYSTTRTEIDKYFSIFLQMRAFDKVGDSSPIRLRLNSKIDVDRACYLYDVAMTYKVLFALNCVGRLDEWGAPAQLELFGEDLSQTQLANQKIVEARSRLDEVLQREIVSA